MLSEHKPLILLGGSFDPIHLGHERLLSSVREYFDSADAALVPAYQNPLKAHAPSSNEDRLAMVQMVARRCQFDVLTLELDRKGASYTVDTLAQLRQSHGPNRPILWCMGADSIAQFTQWRAWQQIIQLVHLVVVNRPGFTGEISQLVQQQLLLGEQSIKQLSSSPFGALAQVAMTDVDLSSTEIREAVKSGQPLGKLVSDDVAAYIKQHQLYI